MPVDLRRAHQCRHDGCDSPAIWRAKLILDCPRPGLPDFRLSTQTSLKVCDLHCGAAAALLMDARNITALVRLLATEAIPPPDMDRIEVEFDPIIEGLVMGSA